MEEYRGSRESLGGWCRRSGCKRRRLKYWLERFSEFSGEDDGGLLGEDVFWTEMMVEDSGDDFAENGEGFSNSLRKTAPREADSERTASDCLGKDISDVSSIDISDDAEKVGSEAVGTFAARNRRFEFVLPKNFFEDMVKAVVKYA